MAFILILFLISIIRFHQGLHCHFVVFHACSCRYFFFFGLLTTNQANPEVNQRFGETSFSSRFRGLHGVYLPKKTLYGAYVFSSKLHKYQAFAIIIHTIRFGEGGKEGYHSRRYIKSVFKEFCFAILVWWLVSYVICRCCILLWLWWHRTVWSGILRPDNCSI